MADNWVVVLDTRECGGSHVFIARESCRDKLTHPETDVFIKEQTSLDPTGSPLPNSSRMARCVVFTGQSIELGLVRPGETRPHAGLMGITEIEALWIAATFGATLEFWGGVKFAVTRTA